MKSIEHTYLLQRDLQKEKEEAAKKKAENKECKEQLVKQKEDQADIYYFLHKKLDDNYELISELERQYISEQTDRERKRREYNKAVEEKENELNVITAAQTEELQRLQDSLHTLKEVEDKKQGLEERNRELDAAFIEEQEKHHKSIEQLERAKIQGKQKLRVVQNDKIRETEIQLEKTIKNELEMNTQKIRQLNEQLHATLRSKSATAEKLVGENCNLTTEGKHLKNQLEVRKSMVLELEQKNRALEKLYGELSTKLKQVAQERVARGESAAMLAFDSLSSQSSYRNEPPSVKDADFEEHFDEDGLISQYKRPFLPPSPCSPDVMAKSMNTNQRSISFWEAHVKALERNIQKSRREWEKIEKRREALEGACTHLQNAQDGFLKLMFDMIYWLQEEKYPPSSDVWPPEMKQIATEEGAQILPLSKLPQEERRRVFARLISNIHNYQLQKIEQCSPAAFILPSILRGVTSPVEGSYFHQDTATLTSRDYSQETFTLPAQYSSISLAKTRPTVDAACQTPWVATENMGTRAKIALQMSASVNITHHKVNTSRMSHQGDDVSTVQTGVSELSDRASQVTNRTHSSKYHPKAMSLSEGAISSFVSKQHKPRPPTKGGSVSQWQP